MIITFMKAGNSSQQSHATSYKRLATNPSNMVWLLSKYMLTIIRHFDPKLRQFFFMIIYIIEQIMTEKWKYVKIVYYVKWAEQKFN